MKIIRKGYFDLTKNHTLFFECSACACLWVADDTEYDQKDYSTPAICKCPCCKAYVKEYPNQKEKFTEVVKNNLLPK